MKFGIFYEHQLPRPWQEDSEYQLMQDAFEQVELADRLGFDVVWEVEHHFLEEYSHSSAPEVFLAACSQRTKDIRLGHGIIQTAPGYNHPARTAERVATLDLISGGRVEFGSGESGSEAELGGFLVDPATKREAWLEGLQVALRCMTETPFSGVDGRFVQMPPRNVVPKPMQRPHPPLWVACSRRDTILLAAEKGIGALTFAFIDPEEATKWVSDYEHTLAERCVPVGLAVNANIACVTQMMCHPDERVALDRGLEGGNFFGYSLGHYYVFGEHRPGSTDVWTEYLDRRGTQGYSPEIETALQQERLGARLAAGDRTGLRGRPAPPSRYASTSSDSSRRGWTRSSSCCRPARTVTSTSASHWSSSAARCSPRSRSATRPRYEPSPRVSPRPSTPPWNGGCTSPCRQLSLRTTRSRPCPGDGRTRRGARRCGTGWSTSRRHGRRGSETKGSESSGAEPPRGPAWVGRWIGIHPGIHPRG